MKVTIEHIHVLLFQKKGSRILLIYNEVIPNVCRTLNCFTMNREPNSILKKYIKYFHTDSKSYMLKLFIPVTSHPLIGNQEY